MLAALFASAVCDSLTIIVFTTEEVDCLNVKLGTAECNG